MANCKECGRSLTTGEKDLCPACQSTQSHKKKTWIEIIFGVIFLIIGGIFKALVSGKSGGKSPAKSPVKIDKA